MKGKTVKLQEKNIREYLYDLLCGQRFFKLIFKRLFNYSLKTKATKLLKATNILEKKISWTTLKLKTSVHQKTIKRVRRQAYYQYVHMTEVLSLEDITTLTNQFF